MTDLFDNGQDQPVTFDELVGEGKKYIDNNAIAKAVAEKDRFIQQLQDENAAARQELRSRTNLEDVVNQLKSGQQNPPPNREIAPTPRQEPTVEAEPVDLEAKFLEMLQKAKQKDSRANNLETAQAGLRDRFGADFKQTLKEVVSELGVSEQFVSDLAATSPAGFLKLIDSVRAPDDKRPVAPPQSRVAPQVPGGTGRRNKAYYDELRRSDVNAFLSPRTQNQYYKDAMEQGESFYK